MIIKINCINSQNELFKELDSVSSKLPFKSISALNSLKFIVTDISQLFTIYLIYFLLIKIDTNSTAACTFHVHIRILLRRKEKENQFKK